MGSFYYFEIVVFFHRNLLILNRLVFLLEHNAKRVMLTRWRKPDRMSKQGCTFFNQSTPFASKQWWNYGRSKYLLGGSQVWYVTSLSVNKKLMTTWGN